MGKPPGYPVRELPFDGRLDSTSNQPTTNWPLTPGQLNATDAWNA